MRDIKPALILAGLIGILAYLTLTESGKVFARKLGGRIVDIAESTIDTIKGFEGFSPVPYIDSNGHSIGYGHYIQPGESFSTLTDEQATALLKSDMLKRWNSVKGSISVPLNQNQIDALSSFVYNEGVSAFINSTLLKKLNSGDYQGAADQFPVWNKSRDSSGKLIVNNTLVARRARERTLFLA